MLRKVGQQMLTKIGQQMLTKLGQQMLHTIETDGRQAGANQQMLLTYTIETADGHTIDGRRPLSRLADSFVCFSSGPYTTTYVYNLHVRVEPNKWNLVQSCPVTGYFWFVLNQ